MAVTESAPGVFLDLNEDQVKLLTDVLEREWVVMAEAAAVEVQKMLDRGSRTNDAANPAGEQMYATDAAWKVRRQQEIVDLLAKLGVVA